MIEAAVVCGHGILSKLGRVRERMNTDVVGSSGYPNYSTYFLPVKSNNKLNRQRERRKNKQHLVAGWEDAGRGGAYGVYIYIYIYIYIYR